MGSRHQVMRLAMHGNHTEARVGGTNRNFPKKILGKFFAVRFRGSPTSHKRI